MDFARSAAATPDAFPDALRADVRDGMADVAKRDFVAPLAASYQDDLGGIALGWSLFVARVVRQQMPAIEAAAKIVSDECLKEYLVLQSTLSSDDVAKLKRKAAAVIKLARATVVTFGPLERASVDVLAKALGRSIAAGVKAIIAGAITSPEGGIGASLSAVDIAGIIAGVATDSVTTLPGAVVKSIQNLAELWTGAALASTLEQLTNPQSQTA